MNRLALLFIALFFLPGATTPAKEKEKPKAKQPYVLYAEMKIGFCVELGDGSKWEVERMDAFPVAMFKEQQTKVVLQLAGTQFWINTEWVTVLDQKEVTAAHLASYRRHVEKYLERQAVAWKSRLDAGK